MDQKKLPKSCDKDSIKIAMLSHEEMFRHQVEELHRLYRKQKVLMNTMKNVKPIAIQPREESGYIKSEELIEESEIELTLGPSMYKSKQRRSISGRSLSSSISTGSSNTQRKEASFRKESKWELNTSPQNSVQIENPPWHFQALTLKLS